MNFTFIIPRLEAEYHYPHQAAEMVTAKLEASAPIIQEKFDRWWVSGDIPELVIEGYSLQDLMARHNMNPIAAFLTLDWLLREPEKARHSLQKGHDYVVIKKDPGT